MSKVGLLMGLISFAGAVLGELVFGFTALLTHEVRAYPVECEGQVVFRTFCDGDLTVPLTPSTFRAFPQHQEVIERSDSGETTLFKHCSVRDFRNWHCTLKVDRNRVVEKTMQDGHLTVAAYDSRMTPKTNVNSWDLVYVPVAEWLQRDLDYELDQ